MKDLTKPTSISKLSKMGRAFKLLPKHIMLGVVIFLTGLPTFSWIRTVDPELTWIYYTTRGKYNNLYVDALYEMAFTDSVEYNSQTYYNFKVVRCVIRPKGHDAQAESMYFGEADWGWDLRESDGKVWIKGGDGLDYLLYDFNVQEDETINNQYAHCFPDTVLNDGISRKMYSLACDYYTEDSPEHSTIKVLSIPDLRIIEGIGPTRGTVALPTIALCSGIGPWGTSPNQPADEDTYLTGVKNKKGEYIYGSRHPLEDALAGVPGIKSDVDATPQYLNLQGVRLTEPQKGVPFIEIKDGNARIVIL